MEPLSVPPTTEYLADDSRRALIHRLARIEGHVRGIRRQVEIRACADEILLQVAAVRGALSRFAAVLVEEELGACAASCLGDDPGRVEDRIERLAGILATLLKQT